MVGASYMYDRALAALSRVGSPRNRACRGSLVASGQESRDTRISHREYRTRVDMRAAP